MSNSDQAFYASLLYKDRYFLNKVEELHYCEKLDALYLNDDKVVSIHSSPDGEFNIDEGNNLCYTREEIWG